MTSVAPDELLKKIDDIKGLDTISAWPLAYAWWIVLVVGVAVPLVFIFFYLRRRAYERSWKGDALRTLAALEARLDHGSSYEITSDLSAILRRIAMQCFSRKECAGLEGREWLIWLHKHDPRGFDWSTHGKLLTEIPYAPPNAVAPPEKIRVLIDAIRPWVS